LILLTLARQPRCLVFYFTEQIIIPEQENKIKFGYPLTGSCLNTFMKKTLLILSLITVLASCKHADTNTPTAAIDGMFTAMKNGNIEETKKYISRTDVAMLEAGESLMSSIDSAAVRKMKEKMTNAFKEKVKDVSYKLKNEKINGDNATVDVEVTGNGETGSHTLDLVKEDGTWKVALSKSGGMFNSMKGDMGPGKKDLRDGIEKLENMHPDSLKRIMDTLKSKMKIN